MPGVNPYQYARKCLFGKWKMTILHHIYNNGYIRFNETRKTLPISEKVLAEQLKELADDGLVERIQYNTIPLKVEYVLTDCARELIPALDIMYIWSVKRMHELGIEIDTDAFDVHRSEKYTSELGGIMHELGFEYESKEG
jgi:DNA-binding HxlR family transcriptional regulator